MYKKASDFYIEPVSANTNLIQPAVELNRNHSKMLYLVVLSCLSLAQADFHHDNHHHHHAQPYKFGYSVKDHHGEQHREESGNGAGGVPPVLGGLGYGGNGGYGSGYGGYGSGYGGYGSGNGGYGLGYGGQGLGYNGYGGSLGYSGLGGYGYSYGTPLLGGAVSGYDSRYNNLAV
ncbi:hypothetical protein CEXT_113281 [Caerostris extrusa]|uniref:Uncharacterized protein n=1 Tax=Caerostris extrusa TaxID=172846 RepID=A0AAV4Y288_CAEEX|nr:hypothetical protein CEXT_113281 [Caerostris extrusa]